VAIIQVIQNKEEESSVKTTLEQSIETVQVEIARPFQKRYYVTTAIFIIIIKLIDGQIQGFLTVFVCKLVLKTVGNCFAALNHYENGSHLEACVLCFKSTLL
jgi:hypothetical protein